MVQLLGAAFGFYIHTMAVELKAVVRRIDADGHDCLMCCNLQSLLVVGRHSLHPSNASLHAFCLCVALSFGFASVGILVSAINKLLLAEGAAWRLAWTTRVRRAQARHGTIVLDVEGALHCSDS